MYYVFDHLEQETTATVAHSKQNLACNNKKKGHLKDGVNMFLNS